MNKWNRVPSICLRSLTGCWARLGWSTVRFLSLGWIQRWGRRDGWCIWKVSLDMALNGGLKASAGRREALIPHLPHPPSLSPRARCPQHSPFPLHMGNLCPFHFYTNVSKMCKKCWRLEEFAPTNVDACMHVYLKFIFYFAEVCQTQSLSKC